MGDDHSTRLIDITDKDMDMDIKLEVGKCGDMPRKQILCPICKSNCPSRRFSEFPLRQKDPSPTTLPFQDNPKPPLPETPKSMHKIHKYMIRTPQVKRKVIEDSEFLELEKQKIPTTHTHPPTTPVTTTTTTTITIITIIIIITVVVTIITIIIIIIITIIITCIIIITTISVIISNV